MVDMNVFSPGRQATNKMDQSTYGPSRLHYLFRPGVTRADLQAAAGFSMPLILSAVAWLMIEARAIDPGIFRHN